LTRRLSRVRQKSRLSPSTHASRFRSTRRACDSSSSPPVSSNCLPGYNHELPRGKFRPRRSRRPVEAARLATSGSATTRDRLGRSVANADSRIALLRVKGRRARRGRPRLRLCRDLPTRDGCFGDRTNHGRVQGDRERDRRTSLGTRDVVRFKRFRPVRSQTVATATDRRPAFVVPVLHNPT